MFKQSQPHLLYSFPLILRNTKYLHVTYVEYRAVSGVFLNIGPPPLSPPSEWVLPLHQRRGGGYTLAGRWGGGGSIFWKTSDIGLASYNIISLRFEIFLLKTTLHFVLAMINSNFKTSLFSANAVGSLYVKKYFDEDAKVHFQYYLIFELSCYGKGTVFDYFLTYNFT